ncbi:MAG: hypothetical protein RDU24_05900 [Humidesulfovibrio sp.]|uniref:hypothetical protein n=1 Tax=Humidesulfovibrio sp. TaxID=2910988 RepID=UPI0027E911E4|nr:hypothetical protein [Humidesulfovibrio sp.]MDQ7834896.1 hypothetical protein [Humidesulfovibrio sp.]
MAHHTNTRFLSLVSEPASPTLSPTPTHPVGLLYTMLRHGRGLSHEEAHRVSYEFFASSQSEKAA